MRKLDRLLLSLGVILLCIPGTSAFAQPSSSSNFPTQSIRIGVVNAKKCLEESKIGKQEQANFEKMKNQMESVLREKEKTLEDIENKVNDDDYMDSISDEAASELKRKRKTIRQEGYQLQNQYLQTLQQTNVKIIQKIAETISKASELVAKESATSNQPLDLILNDEACTYSNPQLDVTDKVIAKMNTLFDNEQKDNQSKNR